MKSWIACSFATIVAAGSGCSGPCSSVDVPGVFRVVSIGSVGPGDGGTADAGASGGQIVLAFTADDPSLQRAWDDVVYYKGDTTASRLESCPVVEAGVTVGQKFRGTSTHVSGSCGPQPYRCSTP